MRTTVTISLDAKTIERLRKDKQKTGLPISIQIEKALEVVGHD